MKLKLEYCFHHETRIFSLVKALILKLFFFIILESLKIMKCEKTILPDPGSLLFVKLYSFLREYKILCSKYSFTCVRNLKLGTKKLSMSFDFTGKLVPSPYKLWTVRIQTRNYSK